MLLPTYLHPTMLLPTYPHPTMLLPTHQHPTMLLPTHQHPTMLLPTHQCPTLLLPTHQRAANELFAMMMACQRGQVCTAQTTGRTCFVLTHCQNRLVLPWPTRSLSLFELLEGVRKRWWCLMHNSKQVWALGQSRSTCSSFCAQCHLLHLQAHSRTPTLLACVCACTRARKYTALPLDHAPIRQRTPTRSPDTHESLDCTAES